MELGILRLFRCEYYTGYVIEKVAATNQVAGMIVQCHTGAVAALPARNVRGRRESMRTNFRNWTLALAVVAATATFASADTIRAELKSVYGQSVSYTLGANAQKSTTAGRFNWQRETDNPATPAFNEAGTFPLDPTPAGDLFYSFCIDLTQTVTYNTPYEFNVESNLANGRDSAGYPSLGATTANNIAQFLGAVFPTLDGSLTTVQAAALQISLWEIIYENASNAFDVLSGNIKFANNTAVTNQAANYLTAFAAYNGAGAEGLHALNSSRLQDQMIQVPGNPNVEEVPEPGTYALMGIGLLAIGFFRRKAAKA